MLDYKGERCQNQKTLGVMIGGEGNWDFGDIMMNSAKREKGL